MLYIAELDCSKVCSHFGRFVNSQNYEQRSWHSVEDDECYEGRLRHHQEP